MYVQTQMEIPKLFLILVMLLELSPVRVLDNWIQMASVETLPETAAGYQFEIP